MSLTWTQAYTKTQRLSMDANADTLTQLKQDWNTGYHLFNAKLSRYFTRKQQFTNLVANQQLYQTPIDSVRVTGISILVTSTYEVPLIQIRDEYQWRNITSYRTLASNWPTYYFVQGNDEISLWPIPSTAVTNGMRFYYQPQDHDLSIEDVTSTTTSATVTATNGSTTITATGNAFNLNMVSCWFQATGVTDTSWYEIVGQTATTLTLKSAYVGSTASSLAWQVGQLSIIPQEYADAPMHYALGNFFMSKGNETRAQYHLGTQKNPGMFYNMVNDCEEEYSSSNTSSVVTGADDVGLNVWMVPPPASP